MGNSNDNKISKNLSIYYSELDKILFLIYIYMNNKITKEKILNIFPELDFSSIEKEKNNKIKNRHFFKWFDMAFNKNIKSLMDLYTDDLIIYIQNERESYNFENEKNINDINNNIKNNNNILKNENFFLLEDQVPNTNQEISLSEQGLRNFYLTDPEHFKNRVLKAPPSNFRWLSWIILSEIPINRPFVYYRNLLTYDLPEETEKQIQKDIVRTIQTPISNIEDIKKSMYRILKALAIIDKEMSYVQGINFIVSFLLINSKRNEIDTFYIILAIFSKTYNQKFGMRGFYLENFPLIHVYIKIYENHCKKLFPKFIQHINKISLPMISWLSPWFQMIFINVFPNDIVLRIWDCFFIFGNSFLISFALSVTEIVHKSIIKITDLTQIQEYLKLLNTDIKNNFLDKDKKINYDIENLINNAIKKYFIDIKEIDEELLKNYPNYNNKYFYNYKKIKKNDSYLSNYINILTKETKINEEEEEEENENNEKNLNKNNISNNEDLINNKENNEIINKLYNNNNENNIDIIDNNFEDSNEEMESKDSFEDFSAENENLNLDKHQIMSNNELKFLKQ
jgi:hypothetical protein